MQRSSEHKQEFTVQLEVWSSSQRNWSIRKNLYWHISCYLVLPYTTWSTSDIKLTGREVSKHLNTYWTKLRYGEWLGWWVISQKICCFWHLMWDYYLHPASGWLWIDPDVFCLFFKVRFPLHSCGQPLRVLTQGWKNIRQSANVK